MPFVNKAGSKVVCAIVVDKVGVVTLPSQILNSHIGSIDRALAKSSSCIGCLVNCMKCEEEEQQLRLGAKLTIIFYKNGREDRRVALETLDGTVAAAIEYIESCKDPFGGQARTLAGPSNPTSFLDQLQQQRQQQNQAPQLQQQAPNPTSFLDQLQQQRQQQNQAPQPQQQAPNPTSFLDQLQQQRKNPAPQPERQAGRPGTAKGRHRFVGFEEQVQVMRPHLTEAQMMRYVNRCQDTSFVGPDRDEYMTPHRVLMAMYATASNDAVELRNWLQEFDSGAKSFYKKNSRPDLREQEVDAEVERILSGKKPEPAPQPAPKPAPKPQDFSRTAPIRPVEPQKPASDTVTVCFEINGRRSRKTFPVGTTLRGALDALRAEGAVPANARLQVVEFKAIAPKTESQYDDPLENRAAFTVMVLQ